MIAGLGTWQRLTAMWWPVETGHRVRIEVAALDQPGVDCRSRVFSSQGI